MQRLLLSALLILALSCVAHATGQEPDKLIYNGKTYELFSNPLEDYYQDEAKRPQFMVGPHTISSGNWRGYVATWEIIDNRLYLLKIDSWLCGTASKSRRHKDCRKVTLHDLFGKTPAHGRVSASWFSGELRVPDGKLLQYVHMGYGSVYERDIFFEVAKGKVIKHQTIDNANRVRPSGEELQKQELEKLRKSPPGNRPVFSSPKI